jgi:hypothetical protein
MYSTCLFCHASLGANEVIERFPVGRRLAFDAEKGRLWVVCVRCGRWNLTPLEERWEAVEDCERRFRGTRLRASTDNVGLARLSEGLELVRVGRPLLPEFAAWRYADEIRRRRRRGLLGAAVVPLASIVLGGGVVAIEWLRGRAVVCRAPDGDGGFVPVRVSQLGCVVWDPPAADRSWRLRVYEPDPRPSRPAVLLTTLDGATATTVAARVLARINRRTGAQSEIHAAVRIIESSGDPFHSDRASQAMWLAASPRARQRRLGRPEQEQVAAPLAALPAAHRLAMEIAANDEAERRAMAGELAALEAAWRDAEEIAGIADSL